MAQQKLTIVGAMKLRKRLLEKATDLRQKITDHHARLETTSPVFPGEKAQTEKVSSWLQSHHDCIKLAEELSLSIQRTNLQTDVTVVLDGKEVKKSIAAWVLRRRELAPLELQAYAVLNDRGLREMPVADPTDKSKVNVVKIVRHYDPELRDKKKDLYTYEPSRIDAALETANATTELQDPPTFDEDKLLQA